MIAFLKKNKGFILPFTMLISTIILLITSGALTLLTKQFYFSKLYRQSQIAYYAGDDAIACAISVDDTYFGSDGLGIFPSSTTTDPQIYMEDVLNYVNTQRIARGLPIIPTVNDIKCGQVAVFDPVTSLFNVATETYMYHYIDQMTSLPNVEEGKTSSYLMHMPLGGGSFMCAKVTVNKTASFRQIIAQGYAKCDNPNGSIERAVVNTTVSN